MKLSVFLAAIVCCQTVYCRRLIDQIETNEIDTDPPSNGGFYQWVKISQPPMSYMTQTLGSRVEFECEAIGSPMPVMQWLKGRQPLTEVKYISTFKQVNLKFSLLFYMLAPSTERWAVLKDQQLCSITGNCNAIRPLSNKFN